MTDNYENIKSILDSENIAYTENEPLSKHCSFRIGGSAALFVTPKNAEELKNVLELVNENECRKFILGKGTNLVFSDNGFDGVVISTLGLNEKSADGEVLEAGAGVSYTELAVIAQNHGLAGLEFAYGIPGSVGGAVYMNAGAYEHQTSEVLVSSTMLDCATGIIREIPLEEHNFGYRESIYKENPGYTVLSARFRLAEGDKEQIRAKMDELMARRRDKQPLEYPSAGSAFKRYPGYYTGALIEQAGLKGYTVGGAQVSEKHAGFIINVGGATAEDVKKLSDHIKSEIFRINGIMIENEIIFVE